MHTESLSLNKRFCFIQPDSKLYEIALNILTLNFSLPYAELKEPFEAYYDGKKMRSRMDFYGDTVQNYLRGDVGAHGTSYKLAYMTNQTHYNMRGCFMTEGNKTN